ncbi:hypothetical protein ACSS6W_010903 [Trichoderma asperelloides]
MKQLMSSVDFPLGPHPSSRLGPPGIHRWPLFAMPLSISSCSASVLCVFDAASIQAPLFFFLSLPNATY